MLRQFLVCTLLLSFGCCGSDETNTTETCTYISVSAGCSLAPQDGGGCITLDGYLKIMPSRLMNCVSIVLSAGTHHLSSPKTVFAGNSNASLTLYGRDGAVVDCVYKSSTSLHSLHFINLTSVTVTGVAMEGCDRPLRFENIRNLAVWNSTFS